MNLNTKNEFINFQWWGAGVVVCLEQGANLHMAQLMPLNSLSLASVKSRLVLPFWYRLTWVVPEKRAVKRVCVGVCGWPIIGRYRLSADNRCTSTIDCT